MDLHKFYNGVSFDRFLPSAHQGLWDQSGDPCQLLLEVLDVLLVTLLIKLGVEMILSVVNMLNIEWVFRRI